MAGAKPMAANAEQVANKVMDCEKSLGPCHRFEAPHVALALARRLVRDLGPVVGIAGGVVVDDGRHDDPVRSAVDSRGDRLRVNR